MKISLSIFNLLLLCTDTESLPFSVLTTEERQQLFPPVLPAFVRFCKAFPPLMEDVVGLLLQYGRICASEDSLQPLTSIHCKFISRRKSAKNVIYFFFFSEQSKYVWKMQQERVIFLLLIGSLHSSEIKRFMLDDENPHAFCFRFSCFIFPLNNSLVYLRQGIHSIAQNEKQNIIIPQIRKILGHLSRTFHLLFLKSICPLSFFLSTF